MLKELKKLNYHGGKDGLLYFICDVVGNNAVKMHDAEVICAHAPGRHFLSVGNLVCYCRAFGWVDIEDGIISVSPSLCAFLPDKDALNNEMISTTVKQLFTCGILDATMFSYDSLQNRYTFKNDLLPLSLSSVRNTLISQGFLVAERDFRVSRFYVSPEYDSLVAKQCISKRKQLSLVRLKKQLEDNELAGDKAELFVLDYERKRIGQPLGEKVKRISEIDVTAGYDIVSFSSCESLNPDRFIEVKAISSSGFFWSKNEYEIAKLKGESYYLYLVELGHINEPGYIPEVIQNPAMNIIETDNWFVETQSYHIMHI